MHGAGFTGSGEDHLASVVAVEATRRRARARADARAPRSARAPTRSSRRSPPTRSASTSTRSRSCSPTPATCPTAGRRWRRARAWSSASWSSRRRCSFARNARRHGSRTAASDFPAACRDYIEQFGPLRASSQYQPPPACTGTTRNIRAMRTALRLGGLRRRGHRRHDDVRDPRRRLRRGAGSREGDQSGAGGRADRRRRRAGDRLDALRKRRLARRPDGERADDQLHHADVDGHAADPRVLRGEPVRATARRAPKESASCRWTAPRRRSRTRSRTRRASTSPRFRSRRSV